MDESTPNETDALQINAQHEGDRLVVLTPEDQDRFVRSCQWVVEASKLGITRDVWLRELHALLSYVRIWAENRPAQIHAVYAAQRDSEIGIYIVPTSERYDFALGDELTELDLDLSGKFPACPCDVFQIPRLSRQSLDHLNDKRVAILIYGDSERTQSEVAT